MTSSWPSADSKASELIKQATATARALGHSLNGFGKMEGGRFGSVCLACHAWAYVQPRSLTRPSIAGEAVVMGCESCGESVKLRCEWADVQVKCSLPRGHGGSHVGEVAGAPPEGKFYAW